MLRTMLRVITSGPNLKGHWGKDRGDTNRSRDICDKVPCTYIHFTIIISLYIYFETKLDLYLYIYVSY